MKAPIRVLAAVLAAALATSTLATPASAFGGYGHHFFFKKKMFFKHHKKVASASSSSGGSNIGPYVVGCIGTTALALIVAALIKKNGELTTQQAQRIAFSFCGSGIVQVVQDLR